MKRVSAGPLVAVLAAAFIGVGCGTGLQFSRDDRLRFISPPERSRAALPVVVAWQIDRHEFTAATPDGSSDPRRGMFAVFLDRTPMRPGEGVDALAEDDPVCRELPGCPDRDWLARRGVYLTTRSAIAFDALPARRGRKVGGRRLHEVTVVLLDGRGARIGESAWTRRFFGPDRGR